MSTPRRRAARSKDSAETQLNSDKVPLNSPARKNPRFRRILLATLVIISLCIYVYCKAFLFHKWQPEEQHVPFTVVDIPGKGKGAVATRDIPQGELIFRERPLFILPAQVSVRGSPGSVILSALASLSPRQHDAFYNLSYVNFPDHVVPNMPSYHEEMALAIFQTNGISAADDGVGLFPSTARLNHGCSGAFNAVYNWRPSEATLVVHALKNIKEGEELLTTYLDTKRSRDSRREILRAHYGFTCQCSVCSLPDGESERSDDRLRKMVELYARLRTWQNGSLSGKQAIDIVRQIWAIGEQEGYWSERGQLAYDATWVAAAHADRQATRAWAKLAKKWYAIELGPDSEHARKIDEVVTDPESLRYKMSTTRRPENVGLPDTRLG